MRASVCCRIRSDKPNKGGLASVYLQVIIDSKRTTVPMKISWAVSHFDNTKGIFLPRHPEDQLATDYNLQVTKEIAKINDIFIFYRHSDSVLTITQFHKEIKRWGARKNFLDWAENDLMERYRESKIAEQTWKNDLSSIRKIRRYKDQITFAELGRDFMENLQAWLQNHEKLKNSSAWRVLKTVTTYARRAERVGLSVNLASLKEYSMPKFSGRIVYLNPTEIQKLKNYYSMESTPEAHKNVLSHFLFSCITGLRVSDIQRVSWKDIHDDMLVIRPYKTRKSEKEVRIALINEHFEYIHNDKGLLFNCVTEQEMNRRLKDIAIACKIRKNITTHVARHTFATEFLRRGGHIEVLQKLMGHAKISTTLVYTHVDDDRLRDQMILFEN